MSVTKYSRYRPGLLDDLDLEDLLGQLSDYFLRSGFQDSLGFYQLGDDMMAELQEAILNALLEQGTLSADDVERMLSGAEGFESSELSQLLQEIIERMQQDGYIRITPPRPDASALGNVEQEGQGRVERPQNGVRFELTDKTIDFLGFKTPVASSLVS